MATLRMRHPYRFEADVETFPMADWRTDQSLGQVTDSDPKSSAGDAAHHTTISSAVEADGDHGEANPRPVSEASVSSNSTGNSSFSAYPFSDIIGEGVFEDMATIYSKEQYDKNLSSPLADPSASHELEALSVDDSNDERSKAPVMKKGKKKGGKKKGKDKGKAKDKQEQEENLDMVEAKGKGKAKATKHANDDVVEDEESDASTIKASSYINKVDFHSKTGGMSKMLKTKDDIGSTHLKPLPEHLLYEKPAEEWTPDEHALFLASFAKKLEEGKIIRPNIVPRLAMRGKIVHSPSEYEPCMRMNRAMDRMIEKWRNGSGKLLNSETTQQGQDVCQPLEESSVKTASRQSATQPCVENIKGDCDSDYGSDYSEKETDHEETAELTKPIGFTHLNEATQKMILESVMPTGIQLFPFVNMSESGDDVTEHIIKLKTAVNIIQALCKRRDPNVLLSGELARNILYRTNNFVFTRMSHCISFVGTVGVENLTRMSFLQNFLFAREIFRNELRTREFIWFQRWMLEIRKLTRGEELVQDIAKWYEQSLHPVHPVVSAAQAMFEIWELERNVAAVVAASKVESGEANPCVAPMDLGNGFGIVQEDLDALLEKAGL